MSEMKTNVDLPVVPPGVNLPLQVTCRDRKEDPEDELIGTVMFPVLKIVQATFTHAGKIQPMPVPDLDD